MTLVGIVLDVSVRRACAGRVPLNDTCRSNIRCRRVPGARLNPWYYYFEIHEIKNVEKIVKNQKIKLL